MKAKLLGLLLLVLTSLLIMWPKPAKAANIPQIIYYYDSPAGMELVGVYDLRCDGTLIQWGTTSSVFVSNLYLCPGGIEE